MESNRRLPRCGARRQGPVAMLLVSVSTELGGAFLIAELTSLKTPTVYYILITTQESKIVFAVVYRVKL